ncbi:MAG: phosphoribosylamine--glycine ligase [Treponema sp.]|nr:phosphoribosylamine--glycine ligase [Treponema sp.]
MKVMVVGGGGREHAIIKSLKKSKKISELFCAPGNGGIAQDATCVPIDAKDIFAIRDFAKEHHIDFVVVSPDDPLVLGCVDVLNEAGIKTFGPRKNAAIIEGSKSFAKNLMKKYDIPTARYEVFDELDAALSYVKNCTLPLVIKADGLALGKGVVIANTMDEAFSAIKMMMKENAFGESGKRVVVEEFLTGPEVSVLAFTDGKTIVPMVSSQDHKRALDGDEGLNTGGMGTVAPNPYYTKEIADECMQKIFLPTIQALQKEVASLKEQLNQN